MLSPGKSISHFPEIESPEGGNISAGGRLCKGAISFWVTGRVYNLLSFVYPHELDDPMFSPPP